MSEVNIVSLKAEKFEKTLDSNSSYLGYIGTALRYYECYRLGYDNGLMKALEYAKKGLKINSSCVWLLLLYAFLEIEAGKGDSALELMDRFKPYRNYYKNNEPIIYAFYIYLNALYELSILGKDTSKRQIKQLNVLSERYDGFYIDLMIADIYFRSGDYPACLDNLEEAYYKGCRSFYMYVVYMEVLKLNVEDENGYIYTGFLKWAITQQAMDEKFINGNAALIESIFNEYINDFRFIYKSTKSELLLMFFCIRAIDGNDLSEYAYKLYKAAGQKQLEIPGLDKQVVHCAFLYGDEDVGVYFLQSFLSSYEQEVEIMPFIFHLMLTESKYNGLMEEFSLKNKILQYGAYAFAGGKRGRIYNSIYRYLLKSLYDDSALENEISTIIYNELFLYDIAIEDLNNGQLYVYEQEKQSVKSYEITNGKVQIESVAGNIRLIVINDKNDYIPDIKYSIARRIQNADEALFEYYIRKGYDNPDIFIALSALYMNGKDYSEEQIGVLSKTIGIVGISQDFRMRTAACLGNILAALNRYESALEYFHKIDESRLDGEYIEIMLTAFINANDLDSSAKLIVKKREYISDRTLFWALKKIASDESMHGLIADPAYELIIKNWYDAVLLSIVIENFAGGNKDLFALRESLSSINVFDITLDKRILENSLWIHDFSKPAQEVFHRLYKTEPQEQIVMDYLYYACYELLVNESKPEYELIADFEKEFGKSNDKLLAYALSKVYVHHNITTFISDEILIKAAAFMEEDSIILPEFKEIKDKKIKTAYIEKNQPFIYRAAAGKTIVLYYKLGNAGDYFRKPMKHFAFGLFMCTVPVFYNESISFFYSEEMEKGSIRTAEGKVTNNTVNLKPNTSDMYFQINNALIYDQMFKYDEAEKIITEMISKGPRIKGKII